MFIIIIENENVLQRIQLVALFPSVSYVVCVLKSLIKFGFHLVNLHVWLGRVNSLFKIVLIYIDNWYQSILTSMNILGSNVVRHSVI